MSNVTVRYFAAAKAAAGVDHDSIEVSGPMPLADVLARALQLRGPELAKVATACSILVQDAPLGDRDPAGVMVEPGDEVHLLPPFAGG